MVLFNTRKKKREMMIGPGCLDGMSVVSEMAMVTVVSTRDVPDEEHHSDNNLPPMMIAANRHHPPMMITSTKNKNLAGSVQQPKQQQKQQPQYQQHQRLAATRAATSRGPQAGGHGLAPSPCRNVPPVAMGVAASRRQVYNATMEELAHERSGGKGLAPKQPQQQQQHQPQQAQCPVAPRVVVKKQGVPPS
jgi:hypothetical protein